MKASNIILVSIVGSMTLLITIGAFQIRFSDHDEFVSEKFHDKSIPVENFNHLKVNNVSVSLRIKSGNNVGFSFKTKDESSSPDINYHFAEDTLIIESIDWQEQNHYTMISLDIPSNVNTVFAKNASLDFDEYLNKKLDVDMVNSKISIHKNVHLKTLNVHAVGRSRLLNFSKSLDTLNVNLHQSNVEVHGLVNHLMGKISDESVLSAKEINNFDFNKDESSKLHHWN